MGVKVREKTKGSGIWWIFIDHQRRRKAKKVALQIAKKVEAKLVLGDMGLVKIKTVTVPTFEEYANTWKTLTVPATCKPSTEKDSGAFRTIMCCQHLGKNRSQKSRE